MPATKKTTRKTTTPATRGTRARQTAAKRAPDTPALPKPPALGWVRVNVGRYIATPVGLGRYTLRRTPGPLADESTRWAAFSDATAAPIGLGRTRRDVATIAERDAESRRAVAARRAATERVVASAGESMRRVLADASARLAGRTRAVLDTRADGSDPNGPPAVLTTYLGAGVEFSVVRHGPTLGLMNADGRLVLSWTADVTPAKPAP